jgi:hypothetical protein
MKKHLTEALIILLISMGGALLLPNFFMNNKTMEWPSISDFTIWALAIFVVISILFYINKPKEKSERVPDGYNELHNANNQVTKKGVFFCGKQVSGTRHVYKKDGTLSHIENCINGLYTKDISKS